MSTFSLIVGALTFRTNTFKQLRDRSDVFYRGFLAVLVVAIIVGAFASGVPLLLRTVHPQNEAAVADQAVRGFEQQYYGPPEMKAMIETYIREGVALGFEISSLPPRLGVGFRPLVTVLHWIGETLSLPFGFGFMGLLLLGGLLVQVTAHWLGGRATNAEMLGLSALAFAPSIFRTISYLLELAQGLGAAASSPADSLIGFLLFVWGVAIYVKATAIAQQFSYGRAIGSILFAGLIGLAATIFVAVVVGIMVAGTIALIVSTASK